LVASEPVGLVAQAEIARELQADLVEWRADFSKDWTPEGLVCAGNILREILPDEPIIFTLRVKAEGGAQDMPQAQRGASIEAVLRSNSFDIVDLEVDSEPEFLAPLMRLAQEQGVRVVLAHHDFEGTPQNELLFAKIAAVHEKGADIAKLAVMPKVPGDTLRLLHVTSEARGLFPRLLLSTMSMGALGSITRVAGFLYGSDIAYCVGREISAPGQIPIKDARLMTGMLLRMHGERDESVLSSLF